MLTEKQLKERKNYIGGSDAGAICGFSKWSSPLDVYYSKIEHYNETEQPLNCFMDWGNELEDVVRQKFSKITGLKVFTPEKVKFHPKYKFLAANVDGLTSDGCILEVKCVGPYSRKMWTENYMPDQYLCQCAHYAMVHQLPKVYLAAFFGIDKPLKIYEYVRNAKFEEKLLSKLVAFWEDHIVKTIPPAPTRLEELKTIYKDGAEDTPKTATNEINDRFYQLKTLLTHEQEVKEKIKDVKALLMGYMGVSTGLYDNDGSRLCTWKNANCNRFDQKAFKTNEPTLFEKYLHVTSQRRFVIY